MISAAEAFDAMLKENKLPSRLILDTSLHPSFETLDRQLRRMRMIADVVNAGAQLASPIYVDLVESMKVQAHAFRHSGQPCIAIHAGAILALNRLFSLMMCHRQIYPAIGDSALECENPWSGHLSQSTIVQLGSQYTPRCATRRHFAQHLEDLVVDYFLLHELKHITNGHVDHALATSGSGIMQEFNWSPSSHGAALFRQTLEMDADCCATSSQFAHLKEILNGHTSDPQPLVRFYSDFSTTSHDWTFAVSSFYRLFGDESIVTADLNRSHPPFRARQCMSVATANTTLIQQWGDSFSKEFVKVSVAAIKAVEESFSLLSGKTDPNQGLQEFFGDELRKYFALLATSWREDVRDQLAPYAMVPLAAATDWNAEADRGSVTPKSTC